MIRGIAVLTIVWSSDESNKPSITPLMITSRARFVVGAKSIML